MEGLVYKENVGRLPPIPRKRRSKISSTLNVTSSGMYSSSESTQDTSCKSGTTVKRAQTRNTTYGNGRTSSPTEESCRQLSYIIMQELATAERHNNAIHDKLVFNEQEMGSMAKEISCLKNKISVLEEKINKQSEINCCCSSTNCCRQLFEKCDKFEEKITAIEGIMSQYGLETAGNDASNDLCKISSKEELCSLKDEASHWIPESSLPEPLVDFDKLLMGIKELNIIAGEGESQMCYTRSGATFQRMAGISLILFANGIVVCDGPFRPFNDPMTQQFLQDILDGYFPSEFQNDYPEGVPFHVDDKRTIVYEIPKKWTAFSGKGYKLGHGNSGKTNTSRLLRQDYSKLM